MPLASRDLALRSLLFAAILLLVVGAAPTTARAAACPGASDPCPYGSVDLIGAPDQSQVNSPDGVGVDPTTGDRFVADRFNDRVVRYDSTWHFVRAYPGASNSQPVDVVVAPDGATYYVVELNANRVREVNATTGATVRTFGSTQGSGDGQLKFPEGVAIDATHLYVADTGNGRVSKFVRANGSFVSNIGGTFGTGPGQFGGFPGGAPPFDQPHFMGADVDRARRR